MKMLSFPRLMLAMALGSVLVSAGETNAVRTLAKGAFSGIKEPRREVITKAKAWQKLWALHEADKGSPGELPKVDFAKEAVIVVTLGQKNSGGYAIEIVGIEPLEKTSRVAVRTVKPKPGAMTIQALTAPFHFAAIPKTSKKVEFAEVEP